jgi:GR25 family glycosyltransferase involved in LPS biosynthesis
MKYFVINLPERSDIRLHWKDALEAGIPINFFSFNKQINNVKDIETKLIKNNIVSYAYSGGRINIDGLTGELDCFFKHLSLYHECVQGNENFMIFEDCNDYNIGNIKLMANMFEKQDLDILFGNAEFILGSNGLLQGHHISCYCITPKAAKKLIRLSFPLRMPLDLEIRNTCNAGNLKYGVMLKKATQRTYKFKHSTEDSNNTTNFNSRQDFNSLLNRFFLD